MKLQMDETDSETLIIGFGYPDRERVQFAFIPADLARSRVLSDDWLRPRASVGAGPFRGETDVYVTVSDFARLLPELRALYDSLRGTATFATIEQQVGFTISGDGMGHITLSGFLEDRAGGDNRLEFRLSYDQTLLVHSISEVDALLHATSKTRKA